EVRVHDVIVSRACLGGVLLTGLGLHVGVHLLAEFLRGSRQRFDLGVNLFLAACLDDVLKFFERRFNGFLLGGLQLVTIFAQRLARGVQQGVCLIAGLSQFGHATV